MKSKKYFIVIVAATIAVCKATAHMRSTVDNVALGPPRTPQPPETCNLRLETALKRIKEAFDFVPEHVLDIGANKGEWSDIVRTIYPSARFTMIEANNAWKETLEGKGYANVIMSLVGSETKKVTYYSKTGPPNTGNSIYRERTSFFDKNSGVVEEKRTMHRVDDLMKDQKCEFVKLDVQGAELEVLRGARKTLAHADILQLELSILSYNTGAPLAIEVISFVGELGFEMFEPVELHYLGNMLLQIDFLFVRRESALWTKFDKVLGLQDNDRRL